MRCIPILIPLALAACGTAAQPIAPPSHYVVFVDRSGSPTAPERARWLQEAGALVALLQAGDSVDVYELHARTPDSAAVFAGRSLEPPADPTLQETLGARRELERLRTDLKTALDAALAGPVRTSGTDVLGFIERVTPAPGRRTRVIVFSDAIHETAELNLARSRLVAGRLGDVVVALVRRHGWTAERLAGVEVCVVLNAAQPSAKPPLNDRRVLRSFYAQLVERVGARLVTFDTRLAFPI